MKILMQTGYGKLKDNLQFQEVEIPQISANEVLVKVKYASINPHDYKVILGKFEKIEKLDFSNPVGNDFSGVIVEAGSSVNHLVEGDNVFGIAKGTIGEYCKVKATELELIPYGVSSKNISVLPVVGMTTIQAFKRLGGIKKEDKLLIHAGSGGVGSFAIQYAKSKGAYIYTTCGTDNMKWVKELGADIVIDYKEENYLNICSDLDIVFDTLGNQYTFDAFKVIKQGGKIVSLLPSEINKQVAKEFKMPKLIAFFFSLKPSKINKLKKSKNAQYEFVYMRPNHTDLSEIETLITHKKITSVIEKIYTFDQSIKAFEHLAKGRTKGKLAIEI